MYLRAWPLIVYSSYRENTEKHGENRDNLRILGTPSSIRAFKDALSSRVSKE
jgi:hypothetical protein